MRVRQRKVRALPALAQSPAPETRPTLDEVRRDMVLPSHGAVRGRIDSSAYAFRPEQMAKVKDQAKNYKP